MKAEPRNRERRQLVVAFNCATPKVGGGRASGRDVTPESEDSRGALCALFITNYLLVGRA